MKQIKKKLFTCLSLFLMLVILLPTFVLPITALESESATALQEHSSSSEEASTAPQSLTEDKPNDDATEMLTLEFIGEEQAAVLEYSELREENVKHFKMTDGTYRAISIPRPFTERMPKEIGRILTII